MVYISQLVSLIASLSCFFWKLSYAHLLWINCGNWYILIFNNVPIVCSHGLHSLIGNSWSKSLCKLLHHYCFINFLISCLYCTSYIASNIEGVVALLKYVSVLVTCHAAIIKACKVIS